MKLAFLAAAALMVLAALLWLLPPLLRLGRQSPHPRGVFAVIIAILFAVPLGSWGLYRLVGTPAALYGVPTQAQAEQATVDQALSALRAHLQQKPDDAQGWQLLGQAMLQMQQPQAALDALRHWLALAPNNASAMVAVAEAEAAVTPDHSLQGEPRKLLEQAVQRDPANQRGLWLLGISEYQQADYAAAAKTWRVLQPQVQGDAKVAQAVAEQIAKAEQMTASPAAAGSVAH